MDLGLDLEGVSRYIKRDCWTKFVGDVELNLSGVGIEMKEHVK